MKKQNTQITGNRFQYSFDTIIVLGYPKFQEYNSFLNHKHIYHTEPQPWESRGHEFNVLLEKKHELFLTIYIQQFKGTIYFTGP